MNECCGDAHDSNFCPMCGKPLSSQPLRELLGHCQRQLGSLQERQKKWQSYADDSTRDEYNRKKCQKIATATNNSIDKWNRWTDALLKAIEDTK